MGIIELFITAVGLSADAFAVAVCKGLSMGKLRWRYALITGLYFGFFQALMPLVGYLLGSTLEGYIKAFDHWIAFALLSIIGANMVREASLPAPPDANASFSVKTMLPLAVATSIDALAVGVSLAFLGAPIVPAISLIGGTTFCLSLFGVKMGNVFGGRCRAKAELAGGVILIIIGIKILTEHLT